MARNRAFSESSGEFVLYFDADDLIGEHHITALHQAIARAPGCVAFSSWDRFQMTPAEASFPARGGYRDALSADWLSAEWLNARPMMQPGMFLIPRGFIEKHGGWDERLSLIDDFEFFARILSRSGGMRYANEARLYYRSGFTGSLSGRASRKSIESAYLSLLLGTNHLLAAENSSRTRRACANILQNFDYSNYPEHADLRAKIRNRVAELGGSDLEPDGPPGFHRLRSLVGWQAARRLQRALGR